MKHAKNAHSNSVRADNSSSLGRGSGRVETALSVTAGEGAVKVVKAAGAGVEAVGKPLVRIQRVTSCSAPM